MADLNVPAGWRVRGSDELVENGDRYWQKDWGSTDVDMCDVSVGHVVSETTERYAMDAILTQKPLPVKPINPDGDMQWVNYSVEQRRGFNRAAYEVLDSQDVEMFERFTGTWKPSSQVSLFFQYRVKPPEPLVRWLTVSSGGLEVYHTKPPANLGAGAKLIRLVETPE